MMGTLRLKSQFILWCLLLTVNPRASCVQAEPCATPQKSLTKDW